VTEKKVEFHLYWDSMIFKPWQHNKNGSVSVSWLTICGKKNKTKKLSIVITLLTGVNYKRDIIVYESY
jgi:hypothetical protein